MSNLPDPHGNHFHCGDGIVLAKDATGLKNESVWKTLERKGLARSFYPIGIAITLDRMGYDAGLNQVLLLLSNH